MKLPVALGRTGVLMGVWLEWVEGRESFPLLKGRPAVIGRSRGADFVLPDVALSRQHCRLHWDGCRAWVHDLGSLNGTYIISIGVRNPRKRRLVRGPEGSLLRLGEVLHPGPIRLRLMTSSRVEAGW